MRLVFKYQVPDDFDRYYELDFLQAFGFSPADHAFRARIRAEYDSYNRWGHPNWLIAEDHECSPPKVVGHVSTVFIHNWVVDALETSPDPYYHPKYQVWIEEGRIPYLQPKEIGKMNATEGLNLQTCHFAWDRTMDKDNAAILRAMMLTRFAEYFAGYRIKAMYAESAGDELVEACFAAGYQVLNDYQGWWDTVKNKKDRPYFLGLDRKTAIHGTQYYIVRLFAFEEPRLQFTDYQREVLFLALDGFTDSAIADALCLAEDTVKARWKSIYGRVENVFPFMLPSADSSVRGREKRRLLLSYLQNHLEELRPFTP